MELTEEVQKRIDSMSYEDMLRLNRFSPVGDPIFQGESGRYFAMRMNALRQKPGGDEEHVRASKAIGWERP